MFTQCKLWASVALSSLLLMSPQAIPSAWAAPVRLIVERRQGQV